MVEKPTRYRVSEPADCDDEWHVFTRESEGDPPRHVGTLVADDPDDAHETATRLFAWYAEEVWVCRTADLHRYAATPRGDESPSTPEVGGEERSYEETEVEGPHD
ncbi:Htur_1727 family rSAM-partnered candidate RiPP [Halarchaeum sp. P4]|uniref:Htur_1727 family rSAM-partnered candidate RiPP n=1 Tax=Halarchaeum sp. P4 TaxID=3421639 RepID=UPI003EBB5E41